MIHSLTFLIKDLSNSHKKVLTTIETIFLKTKEITNYELNYKFYFSDINASGINLLLMNSVLSFQS